MSPTHFSSLSQHREHHLWKSCNGLETQPSPCGGPATAEHIAPKGRGEAQGGSGSALALHLHRETSDHVRLIWVLRQKAEPLPFSWQGHTAQDYRSHSHTCVLLNCSTLQRPATLSGGKQRWREGGVHRHLHRAGGLHTRACMCILLQGPSSPCNPPISASASGQVSPASPGDFPINAQQHPERGEEGRETTLKVWAKITHVYPLPKAAGCSPRGPA